MKEHWQIFWVTDLGVDIYIPGFMDIYTALAMCRWCKNEFSKDHFIVSARSSNTMTETKQPQWTFVQNLGDVDPIADGGTFVYSDATGVYQDELEVLIPPSPGALQRRWEIYRFSLDFPNDDEWFMDKLGNVASFCNTTKKKLYRLLNSPNPVDRAGAYQAIGGYFGYNNFDPYPLILTYDEVKERYKKGGDYDL